MRLETSSEQPARRRRSLLSLGTRIAQAGLFVIAAFLPLSIVGAQLGFAAMLVGVAVAFAAGRRGLVPTEIVWPVAAFAAVCLLASFVSPVELPWRSWIAWRPVLLALLVPAAVALFDDPERAVRRALGLLLGAALFVAVLGVLQRDSGFDLNYALGLRKAPVRIESPSGQGFAAVGTFNSRLTFAAIEAAIFVMALSLAFGARGLVRRLAPAAVAVACALAVVSAYARAAWLGAFAGIAVLVLGMRRKAALALAGVALLAAVAGAAVPSVRDRAISAVRTTANQDRLFIWSRAGEVLADHPVLGVGMQGYPIVAAPYYDKFDPHFPMRTWAHDMYFTLLLETGPAGLLAYVWIFVAAAALAFGALRSSRGPPLSAVRLGALGAATSILVDSLFHDVLYDGEAAMTLFFFAGLAIVALGKRSAKEGEAGS
ncbi:MAG: O-antigen ligase family protein [Myxococcales bacterium]